MELSTEQIAEYYQRLKSQPVEDWQEENHVRLLARIAHQTDLEDFTDMFRDGELPPLELSDEEMQAVKGGGLFETLMKFVMPKM